MRSGRESECDYERLFGEALDQDELRCTFLPFRPGEADPCERLLRAIGVERCEGLGQLDQRANAQPGWQAVWIAQRIARQLQRNHLEAWRASACKARIRAGLEQLAEGEGWPSEPYQGLNETLLNRIEERYFAGNERFARRVWGAPGGSCFPAPPLAPVQKGRVAAQSANNWRPWLISCCRMAWRPTEADQPALIKAMGIRWNAMPPWRWLSRALRKLARDASCWPC